MSIIRGVKPKFGIAHRLLGKVLSWILLNDNKSTGVLIFTHIQFTV